MAKFIVTESNFTPFTYDELVKPIAALQEKHDKTQEMYDALNMEASAMRRYLNNDAEDSDIRKAYDATMSQLSNLQENLWNNGINARTKRDLSLAKSSYASTMPRIQEAIKKRQSDSKSYWDARKQNPKLVTGIDPASGGLNNYFLDDTYGNNWFTYDSGVLEKEVATELATRGQDYIRALRESGRIAKNPALAGWLTRDLTKGFTNDEVNEGKAVSDAVRNMTDEQRKEYYEQHNVSPAAQILTETLIDRYNATGVREANITPEEADRLWYGGQNGFYGSILGHDIKDFEDKQWILAHTPTKGGKGGSGKDDTPHTYNLNQPVYDLTTAGFADLSKAIKTENEQYQNGEKGITLSDGSVVSVDNPWTMADYIYNNDARKEARDIFGLDVALPAQSFWGTTKSKQQSTMLAKDGSRIPIITGKMSKKDAERLGLDAGNDVGIYTGKDVLDDYLTTEFNKYRHAYEASVEEFQEQNPGVDIEKMAITPAKERELRQKYNIPSTVSSEWVPRIIETLEYTGQFSPAVLVSSDSGDNYSRDNFVNALIDSFNAASAKGGMSKGSPYAIYKAGADGKSVIGDGETDITKVLGTNMDTQSVTSITVDPRAVAAAAGGGTFKLQFSSKASTGTMWAADVSMFGSQVATAAKAPLYHTGNFAGWTLPDVMHYAILPLINPNAVAAMSRAQSQQWATDMYQLLRGGGVSDTELPVVFDAAGNVQKVGAKDILANKYLRDQLYTAAQKYCTNILRGVRDINSNEHPQYVGNSSARSGYFTPIN